MVVGGAATLTLAPASLPGGTNGSAYAQTITATGGTAPYTYAVTAGALPAGLVLASNGALSGTPTVAGTSTFTITGTDALGNYGTQAYTVAIAGANTLSVSPTTLPAATNGTSYNETLNATGGTGPYTYAVSSGALPAGMTLSSTGDITGTPTVAGTYTFTVSVVDANGNFGTQAFTVTVAGANALTVTPPTLPNGTNGTAYAQSMAATGGTGPYAYTVSAGALPTGLTLAAGGALSGTPTVAGTSTFTVSVVDANGDFGSQAYTVTIAGANTLSVSPTTLPAATNGTSYNEALNATGGTGPYTYSVSSGALPAGLTLSPTGGITGTPTTAGTYTFTIQVIDANGDFGTQAFTVAVAGAATLSIDPATLPGGTNGTAYSASLVESGGTAPYTFAVTSGALPAGLALDSAGLLSGTPTIAGSYTFTVTGTDANGDFGSRSYTVSIAGADVLAISPATLPAGTNGSAYNETLTASGGTGPYSYSVSSGSLPTGVTLSSTGDLTGTPTVAGTYTFTVSVIDANGDFGSQTYSVTVAGANALTISPSTLPAATNGTPYNQTLTTSGGTAPYTYSVSSGSLPTGVTLSSTGDLTGTPATAGTYTFTVSVIDANGDFGSQTYSVTVAGANALTISPATLPAATNGSAYNETLTTSGGTAPYTYSVSSGSLPTGVTLSSTGDLIGTPTTAGTYTFTVSVIDANGDFGSQTYSVTVAGANALTISPSTLPAGTNGSAYNETLTASGGTAPYSYSVSSGSLPTGVTLSSTGDLTGTPTTAGTYTFTVSVIDANGDFGSQTYSVTVAGANALTIAPATLPGATNGSAYNETLTASGGTAPYSYSVSSGSLPTGVTLSSTGDLTGTPTTAGTYTFTVSVIDANGDFGSQTYSVTVAGANALTISPSTLPAATNGSAYNETLTTSGGTAPYTYSVSSGSLPTGVTLSSTGVLTGTPTVAGTYTFTVSVIDANGDFGSQTYSVTVAGANALTISPATLPAATNGTAYNQTLTTAGGTAPYTYSVSSGSLPTGLALSSTGGITGTPTTAGTYTFTVSVIDANGDFGSQTYSVTVAGANALTISPSTLPSATNGTAYTQTLTTSGGTAPYTYAVSSGSLPTGLVLSSTGDITGTPTTAGTYTLTVSVIDANGDFGSQTYSVTVAGANALTISPSTLPAATNGTAYNQTLTTSGGTAPYTYSVSSGALPTGVSLSSTGDLTGTPTVAGTYTFTVSVIDANGDFGSQTYSVTVAGANTLTVTPPTLPNGTNGTAYAQSMAAIGGTGPYTYVVSSGTLPTGLSLASGGALTGTPTVSGSSTFTVSVTDANGNFGSQAYTVAIAGANTLTVTPPTLPNGTNGTAYAQSMAAVGGTGPYTYVVSSGTLPTGLSLASGGALSGTPSVAGTSTFTVSVTDANGNFGSQAYTVAIAGATNLAITPATLPAGTNGAPYTQAITATGGTPTYAYTITSGALPSGLTLTSAGALSGTPTTSGSYTLTVGVTDANGNSGTQAYTLVVAGAQSLTINPGTLPNGNAGAPYSQAFNAGGVAATYTVASGAVPPGLVLGSNGVLSGTPTAAGTYTFTVRGDDANGNFGTRTVTLLIGDSLRADPTRDPGVSDGIQGQVDAARRAGELQMGHVFRRLASSPTNCTVREGEASNDDACDDRIQVWATGTREQHYNRDGSSYLGAFTVGGDVAVGTGRFGVALGSGWDAATRASGVRGDVDSRAMMVYGRIPVQDAIAIDVVAGKSSLDLDNRRTTTGGTALGNRDGDTTFGGIGIAADWTIGAATLAPYARYEFASTQLDGYAEAGPNAVALSYSQLRTRTTSFVFGTELGYGLHFDWGTLTPRLRIEMRQRNGDDVSQAMAYVDRPATQYLLVRPGVDDRAVLAAFGVEAAFHGVTLQLEYGTAGSALDNFEGQTLRFGLRAGF
ncbi:putative Ig domain-containing protein [Noviluteimonas caseinilytica]